MGKIESVPHVSKDEINLISFFTSCHSYTTIISTLTKGNRSTEMVKSGEDKTPGRLTYHLWGLGDEGRRND